jgi:PIN domain nuclease of toxin-antitoxin system
MSNFVTDTHGLIWYLEDSPRLGIKANQAFDACDRGEIIIYVPTICLIEIIYLQEKGRIPSTLFARLDLALQADTNNLVLIELTREVVHAVSKIPRTIVPELPDRIIAGTALCLSLPLITQDSKIQQLPNLATIW